MRTAPVSVVIPTHNRAELLPEAIYSALAQGPLVGEVLVVDDGSTDNTADVVASIEDDRVRLLRQEQSGPAAARETGWRAARGEWIQFLDSDDALADGAIEALHAPALREPGCIPFGQESVHGEHFDEPAFLTGLAFAHRSGRLLREICFYSSGTIWSCLFPRASLEAVGGLRVGPEAALCEDFDFAVRLGMLCEFAYLPRVTYRARMHSENRHRAGQRVVWEQAMGCVSRRLAGRPGVQLLKRRAMAYYQGLIAGSHAGQGDLRTARRLYAKSLVLWPVKLGAWKGWLCTWRTAGA